MVRIRYELNGGYWSPKDEVKDAFLSELYHFINERYVTEPITIPLDDFLELEPYLIGNYAGKYFLKEKVGGKLEDQPDTHFIGYCFTNGKYIKLIHHLISFFALWREIEGCREEHATDFFANSWASLVDTAKFFKYTTMEDLQQSPESPTVQCEPILRALQSCPGLYEPPQTVNPNVKQRLPKPRRKGYRFEGWYRTPDFQGEAVTEIDRDMTGDITYYARWRTFTILHSNDGYVTFESLYQDFLDDFSAYVGETVGMGFDRDSIHGRISPFLRASGDGKLNDFFRSERILNKWSWLIDYLKRQKRTSEEMQHFEYRDGAFGSEDHVRWELNSLFVGWFHLEWPKTNDYSGPGIKEQLVLGTNSSIQKVEYLENNIVNLPTLKRDGYNFVGWFDNPDGEGDEILKISDGRFASRTLYAKWEKIKSG